MTTIFKKFATGTAALALMTTVFVGTGFAAEGDSGVGVESNIISGPFTLKDVALQEAFQGETLDGQLKDDTATLSAFNIVDASGLGNGWDVSISASAFTNTTTATTLSPGTLTIAEPNVTADLGTTLDGISTSLANSAIDGDSVKLVSAVEDKGMGTYNVAPIPMKLDLKPSEVYAGKYTSTVSITLAFGPTSQ